MDPTRKETPFLLRYAILLAAQLPAWMVAGMVWATMMIVLIDSDPVRATLGGLAWGVSMWLFCGNLFAVGLAWRRTVEIPAPDRTKFLAALHQAAEKMGFTILAESSEEVVLGPKRTLVRFRSQEMHVAFGTGIAVVTGPALSLGSFRKKLMQALDRVSVGEK